MEEPLLLIFRRIVAAPGGNGGGGSKDLPKRLIRIVQPVVAGYLYRYRAALGGRDPRAELEDVLQDVLLALFKNNQAKLATWDEERGTPETFLRQVAAAITLSHLRKRREELSSSSDPPVLEGSDDEARVLSADELRYLKDRLEEELTELEKMVFDLRYLEELPAREVAVALGTTPAAIDSMRHRIGKKLGAILVELRNDDFAEPTHSPARPRGVSGVPPRPKPSPSGSACAPPKVSANGKRQSEPQAPAHGGLETEK